MKNQNHNNNSISFLDFQDIFTGSKTMAIVGSSESALHWENGEFIDSHDVVVRFNRTIVDGLEQYVGSRTDIIVANDSNNLKKAPSPEFTSRPKCVVSFVKTNSVGCRAENERRDFLEWTGATPLFFCPGPEVLCCDVPRRKRGFSMGTYAIHALPYFLNIKKLFVTGFTMFGESNGGSEHFTKKSTRASLTWHDADLERYIAANALAHHTCELVVTDEVAEFVSKEGFSVNVRGDNSGKKFEKLSKRFTPWWHVLERLGKTLITTGYHLRRIAEQGVINDSSRK